jgi:hypothetical protein
MEYDEEGEDGDEEMEKEERETDESAKMDLIRRLFREKGNEKTKVIETVRAATL